MRKSILTVILLIVSFIFISQQRPSIDAQTLGYALSGTFYTSDVTTISNSVTNTTASPFVDVGMADVIAVSPYFTGATATCVSDAIFKFVVSPAMEGTGTNWGTIAYATVRVTANGTNRVQRTALIDVEGLKRIKVLSIENADTDSGDHIGGVNVIWSLSY